ncbi:MAG TPA: polysaccharide biosynthesis/export family protein [Gemmatimonadales bacterium]|nr:polysaccharide biosynthesis/export family protein [Gemmatimonadales bacterium]
MRLAIALLGLGAVLALRPAAAQTGDIRPGDRILLQVDGEKDLSDTFTVEAGPAVTLPAIGQVSLAGVAARDLASYFTRELGRYLKDPVVHAQVLVRVGILGEVMHPGFYGVPRDALLSDALMAAGGPTRDAKMTSLKVTRGGTVLLGADTLQRALAHGGTLADLGLHSGDEVLVPHNGDAERTFRIIGVLITVPATIFALSRVF